MHETMETKDVGNTCTLDDLCSIASVPIVADRQSICAGLNTAGQLLEGYMCTGCGRQVDSDEVRVHVLALSRHTACICGRIACVHKQWMFAHFCRFSLYSCFFYFLFCCMQAVRFKNKAWHDTCYRSSFNNDSLRRAVDLWCSSRPAAESHFGHISTWNTSQVTNMAGLFKDRDFNDNIGAWDVSNVVDMSHMFAFCSSFNRDISRWNVTSAVDMSHMFYYSRAFNQPIGKWDVQSVRSMKGMFANTAAFNQQLDSWMIQEDCDLNHMFYHAFNFSQDLHEAWSVSRRSMMKTLGMFEGVGERDSHGTSVRKKSKG
ncbi:BspA family leucine-rich repeat surface protein [archaeon]|nr:MAG: BspA family leucine-rich repeat surface protein [archaeon]